METAAIAVVVSGAPGSGKTTLASALSEAMWIPHLNKDTVAASLRRGGATAAAANKRAFELVYGTAASWMTSGMSVVIDMTMYPEYSPAEVGELLPHGAVVNVHCRAQDAAARWETKMRQYDPVGAQATIESLRWVYGVATDPLELGCPRIEVDTTEGYSPRLDDVIAMIETEHQRYISRT
ncbi:MAG: AAA family ATPase [Acidimicrobiales bacterium]